MDGALVVGIITGIICMIVGVRRELGHVGFLGLVSCILAGFSIGLPLVIPAFVAFLIVILDADGKYFKRLLHRAY